MEFKTVKSLADKNIIKGYWKPLFKTRLNNDYVFSNRKEYEENLRNQIFGKDNADIVIAPNKYPFNLGEGIHQLVIWIRDEQKDPGIEKITEIIDNEYPNSDYIVMINKRENRSILSILHYHAMLKEPSYHPIYLDKLIVFFRHGNRQPIHKFPIIEKKYLGNNNYEMNLDAELLPIGYKNAVKFGEDLKEIYHLNKVSTESDITNNIACFTSPKKRCIDTLAGVMEGIGIKNYDFTISEKLIFPDSHNLYHLLRNLKSIKELQSQYNNLLTNLDNILGMNEPNDLAKLYKYYSGIPCYQDLGINIHEYIGKNLMNDLTNATIQAHNKIFYYYQLFFSEIIKDLISSFINTNGSLVLCSTHDNLIFVFAKYLAKINNINVDLEMPHYLSNIRIEKWSDGTKRVYYNNCYLGNNY